MCLVRNGKPPAPSAATIQVMNSTFARSLGKPARPETKAEHPSVPTSRLWRCSFSQLVETCQGLISQHYQCFSKKSYLVSSKPVPPQQSSYPLVWYVLCFWLGVAVSVVSWVWHCETGVRTPVRKLEKNFGCAIPCPVIPCYMRDASSITASQGSAFGHNRSNDKEGLELRKWKGNN